MSLTRTVPAAVPSVFHSSSPCVGSPSVLEKKTVPLTFTRLTPPTALSSTVPEAVPSLFHRPTFVPSDTEARRDPLSSVIAKDVELGRRGLGSTTRAVPAPGPAEGTSRPSSGSRRRGRPKGRRPRLPRVRRAEPGHRHRRHGVRRFMVVPPQGERVRGQWVGSG